jgi:hypothetical protein
MRGYDACGCSEPALSCPMCGDTRLQDSKLSTSKLGFGWLDKPHASNDQEAFSEMATEMLSYPSTVPCQILYTRIHHYVAAKERVHVASLSLAVLHCMRGTSVHRQAGQGSQIDASWVDS